MRAAEDARADAEVMLEARAQRIDSLGAAEEGGLVRRWTAQAEDGEMERWCWCSDGQAELQAGWSISSSRRWLVLVVVVNHLQAAAPSRQRAGCALQRGFPAGCNCPHNAASQHRSSGKSYARTVYAAANMTAFCTRASPFPLRSHASACIRGSGLQTLLGWPLRRRPRDLQMPCCQQSKQCKLASALGGGSLASAPSRASTSAGTARPCGLSKVQGLCRRVRA